MIDALLKKIFGTKHERDVKRMMPVVQAINGLEASLSPLDDAGLRAKSEEFKKRIEGGEPLDEILPEAFAVCREAARRTVGMRHFDVQLIGGMVLHDGKIAEMATGEGKTLVATLPAYLNGLTGRGVHIVTVNDYLAKRDAQWMGPIFHALGLRVGVIQHEASFLYDPAYVTSDIRMTALRPCTRQDAYRADVTYGTNNEFGFDYLRDNMRFTLDELVQRELHSATVGECTGRLLPGRRWSDGLHQAVEAKEGVRIERENQTLATITFQNYFRMYAKLAGMTGTAETEAEEFAKIYKLDVTVVPTNQTLRRVNFPDVVYKTEREKFNAVVDDVIERHQKGQPCLVGTVSIEKSETLSSLLKKRGIRHEVLNAKYHEREAEIVAQAGREGAVTIATNMAGRGTDILLGGNPDFLSKEIMRKRGLDPVTAAAPEREAALGEARRITEPEHKRVIERGGLHIVGTERHEARRVDNQLRGRSGRQGDPGSSRFYLSLQDDLLRIFGSQRVERIMERLGMEEGEPIEHKLVTRAIATAQKRVETHNFEIRKHLLEYDDVMNRQREVIYGMRRQILEGESQDETIASWLEELTGGTLDAYAARGAHPEDWDLGGLTEALHRQFDTRVSPAQYAEVASREGLDELVQGAVKARFAEREQELGPDLLQALERHEMLIVLDTQWKDHLLSIDHLKEGIGLRGYGQRDPLTEYKKEAFDLFEEMFERVKAAVIERLVKVQIVRDAPMELPAMTAWADARESRGALASEPARAAVPAPRAQAARTATGEKIGRNDPCFCGSGKKYKKCHYLKT